MGVLVAGVVVPPLVAPVFVTWSELNCWHQEINIKTGQARYTRYLWFIKTSERIEDTELSRALSSETVDIADVKPWHFANTFSPGVRNSPHYLYHSALHQASQFDRMRFLLERTDAPMRTIAKTILTKWQESGDDREADLYLNELIEQGLDVYVSGGG